MRRVVGRLTEGIGATPSISSWPSHRLRRFCRRWRAHGTHLRVRNPGQPALVISLTSPSATCTGRRRCPIPRRSPYWDHRSIRLRQGQRSEGALLVTGRTGATSGGDRRPLRSGRRLVSLAGTLEQVLARPARWDAYVRVVLHESARVGLADEVRAVIPDAVEVVLESPSAAPEKNGARQGSTRWTPSPGSSPEGEHRSGCRAAVRRVAGGGHRRGVVT